MEYAPPGYLLYVRESNLLAQPFDAVALRTTGEPLVIVEQLPSFGTGWAEFSVSENGVLAHETKHSSTRLVWFDRTGREAGLGRRSGRTLLRFGFHQMGRESESESQTPVPGLGTYGFMTCRATPALASRSIQMMTAISYGRRMVARRRFFPGEGRTNRRCI